MAQKVEGVILYSLGLLEQRLMEELVLETAPFLYPLLFRSVRAATDGGVGVRNSPLSLSFTL